ncbi:MAG TPA: hypothetical protein VI423_10840 [Paenisporosarcina sp.]|nr:hypothetical protein [Paenisporosarcina sp.]
MLRHIVAPDPASVITFKVDPLAYFEPGQAAQLYINGSCVVCGPSDGLAPYGIIDDVKNGTIDTTKPSGRVTVWMSAVHAETDQFDPILNYLAVPFGWPLYVNSKGRLTITKVHKGRSVQVGEIIDLVNGLLQFTFAHQLYNVQLFPNANGILEPAVPRTTSKQNGMTCHKCNTPNQYIDTPNQPDGTYECYGCRSGF